MKNLIKMRGINNVKMCLDILIYWLYTYFDYCKLPLRVTKNKITLYTIDIQY